MQVANSTPSMGMPASARMRGFTTMMYDMVINVVTPPSISCRILVLCSVSLNHRSSTAPPAGRQTAPIYMLRERQRQHAVLRTGSLLIVLSIAKTDRQECPTVNSQSMPGTRFIALARFCLVGASLLGFSPGLPAKVPAKKNARATATPEQRAERALQAARGNPLDLRNFLVRMPKGADLHNHLSGAIYAETWIRDAAEDGLCVDPGSYSFAPPVTAARSSDSQPDCGEGKVLAAK